MSRIAYTPVVVLRVVWPRAYYRSRRAHLERVSHIIFVSHHSISNESHRRSRSLNGWGHSIVLHAHSHASFDQSWLVTKISLPTFRARASNRVSLLGTDSPVPQHSAAVSLPTPYACMWQLISCSIHFSDQKCSTWCSTSSTSILAQSTLHSASAVVATAVLPNAALLKCSRAHSRILQGSTSASLPRMVWSSRSQ